MTLLQPLSRPQLLKRSPILLPIPLQLRPTKCPPPLALGHSIKCFLQYTKFIIKKLILVWHHHEIVFSRSLNGCFLLRSFKRVGPIEVKDEDWHAVWSASAISIPMAIIEPSAVIWWEGEYLRKGKYSESQLPFQPARMQIDLEF